MWTMDRNEGIPLYRQIVYHIEKSISCGELPPGSFLPSERKLAERLGVNRSTVIMAYDELLSTGLIESKVGSGRRVSMTKWGIQPVSTPNWRQYTEGGTFLPNLALIRRIREVGRTQPGIIDMASGELSPDLFAGELVRGLLAEGTFRADLGYGDPQGYLPLREIIAETLADAGIETTEASVLVTSGSQQSLYLITQCLLSPGDAVAIEAPSYCYSLPLFQSAGLKLFRLPVHEDGIEPEDIVALYRQHRIRMIFVNPNFQNPTGTVLGEGKRAGLLRIAAELRIPIVEDDPFSMTAFHMPPPSSLKSMDRDGIVIYIGSLSKTAASGLRIGWLVAPRSVVARLSDAREQMDFGLSVLPQWAAAALLRSNLFREHIVRVRLALATKQATMKQALAERLGDKLSFAAPAGGLNMWCRLNGNIDDGKLLEETIRRGALFVPGSVYGSPPGFARLSFARPRQEDIPAGIQAFSDSLRI